MGQLQCVVLSPYCHLVPYSGQTGSGKTFTMLGENTIYSLHCILQIVYHSDK